MLAVSRKQSITATIFPLQRKKESQTNCQASEVFMMMSSQHEALSYSRNSKAKFRLKTLEEAFPVGLINYCHRCQNLISHIASCAIDSATVVVKTFLLSSVFAATSATIVWHTSCQLLSLLS